MTEPQLLGFGAAWLLGAAVGLTACTVSCLPFMGGWVLGRAAGGAAAFEDASAFVAGRVAGYVGLGLAAGAFGELVLGFLDGGAGHLWIGLGAVVASVLLLGGEARTAPCAPVRRQRRLPPALLGAALALVPCAPLASLVAAAAASGGAPAGGALGLAFGLGAALTPLLIVLPALGALGRAMRSAQPWLGRWLRLGGAAILAVVGGRELAFGAVALVTLP